MIGLYTPDGYLDMGAVMSDPHPFKVVVGARGCGKTYGALKTAVELGLKFIYFRRTEKIVTMITDPAIHVFKPINTDTGWEIEPEKAAGMPRFVDQKTGATVGYAAALSTFANVRGFDASDIDLLIYDEFIPEPTERVLFNAYTALLNAVETVGRNRELQGKKPLAVVLMSNSDLIYSDIISGLRIGDKLLGMQETSTEWLDVSPELLLIRPAAAAFREKKADTVLYRLTRGTTFSDMALDNIFPIEDRERIREGLPLIEFIPVVKISGITIWKHKSNGTYYVTTRTAGAPREYGSTPAELDRFRAKYGLLYKAYTRRKVLFSDLDVQAIFKGLFE